VIRFIWPWALSLLPLPLAARWFPPARPKVEGALRIPFCRALLDLQAGAGDGAVRRLRRQWGIWLLWVLLVSALARPVWVETDRPALDSGRDLLLLLDISGSMRQMDFERDGVPLSRFDLMRESASRFLAARQGDRVGLILFGEKPHLRAPPTWDHRVLAELIAEAKIALAGESTAIGDAVVLGIRHLRQARPEGRVMVLITDGANNEGRVAPLQAAQLARRAGIRIHTIGLGRPEAPAPNPWGIWSTEGAEKYERALLEGLARQTGGRFAHALDAAALEAALAAIEALEPTPDPRLALHLARPLHPWLLVSALVVGLAWRWRRP